MLATSPKFDVAKRNPLVNDAKDKELLVYMGYHVGVIRVLLVLGNILSPPYHLRNVQKRNERRTLEKEYDRSPSA